MRLLLPIITLFFVLGSGAYFLKERFDSMGITALKLSKVRTDITKLKKEEDRMRQQIESDQVRIAKSSEFLREWENAQSRGLRGGAENTAAELAQLNDVVIVTPKYDPAGVYVSSGVPNKPDIKSRRLYVMGDGKIGNVLRFASELERSLPLSIIQSVQIRSSERDPKVDIDMQVLDREFVQLPDVSGVNLADYADAHSPDEMINERLLSRRPDPQRSPLPKVSDNLIARGGRAASNEGQRPKELATIIPDIKVTGLLWHTDPIRRRLVANGYILRPGKMVPRGLINTSSASRVRLVEIYRDRATFEIETDEFNTVNGKTETSTRRHEMFFSVFEALHVEG